MSPAAGTRNGAVLQSSRNSAKKVPAKARAHSSAMSYRPSSRPGSGTPNSRLNSAWWFSDQRRNSWQAATILTVSLVA